MAEQLRNEVEWATDGMLHETRAHVTTWLRPELRDLYGSDDFKRSPL